MKKFFAISLCISFLLIFTGCPNNQPLPTTEPNVHPSEDTAPSESVSTESPTKAPLLDIENIPLWAFSAPIVTQEYKANDGTVLFTYVYQNISLILEDPQIADAICIDFLNYVDYENSAAKSILSEAKDAYTAQSGWFAYSYSTLFDPQRFDQSVLSLYGTHAMYRGAPRPTALNVSVTYDLLSGRPLTLKDILVGDFSADTLSEKISEALSGFAAQGMLYSDYAYVVSELFSTNKPVDNWYLSENGLCFYFAPYEIAPYSAGTIIAEISYGELIGLMKEEYFPAESIDHVGQIYLSAFQDADLTAFDQFAELVLDSNGNQYILHTNGCLKNLRIELGTWYNEGIFVTESTVFLASELCNSDAVMLQLDPNMPQGMRITYTAEDTVFTTDLPGLLTTD